MNFGHAIEALKAGKKVAREGWLGANCHPHMTIIIITPTTAELVEGCAGFTTTEFVRD